MKTGTFQLGLRVALGIGVAATPLCADVVEIPASRDNTLIENAGGHLSNGIGEYMFVGRTAQGTGDDIRRAVIAFDVASALPAGSTVDGVTLQLYCSRVRNNVDRAVGLHRITRDWGEGDSDAGGNEGAGAAARPGDATWLYTHYDAREPASSPPWASAGGDFVAAAADVELVGGTNSFYIWGSTPAMVADVQSWLDDPAANHGWILIGVESTGETVKRFNTRQFAGQSSRLPKLVVTFTPAVPTGACCLPDGSCTVVTSAAECAGQGGDFQGLGVDCASAMCPQPLGACCLSGGICQELTADACALASGVYQGDLTDCTGDPCSLFLEPYVDALPIPPLATPVSGIPGGVATYEMAIRETLQPLHRDLPPTTVWGYDDGTHGTIYPGPTILATAGDPVTVTWLNDLRYATGPMQGQLREEHYLAVDLCPHGPNHSEYGDRAVVITHLHGGHVPPRYDGYPEHRYGPGESATYVYPNDQVGGTIWYHDHALGVTRLNVMMGLAGGYVLRDQRELELVAANAIPSGEFDLPLILQDRTIDASGAIVYPATWQDHFYGAFAVVNGRIQPYLLVKRGKYRFRLLGGSNSRAYTLGLSDGAPMTIIGTDGGLLETPVTVGTVDLGPGERVEVIVDFAGYPNGTEILLTNTNAPTAPGAAALPELMKFVVQGGGGFTDPLPAELRVNETIPEGDAVRSRDFVLRKEPGSSPDCGAAWWLINGLEWDDITEFPELGTTEIWRFVNASGQMHPMHMHLVFFQVLDHTPIMVELDGSITETGPPVAPGPSEGGWKDTVRVMPATATRVIARFEDYAGKYAYHCHILEHEDHEMMRQFRAVLPCAADTDRDGEVGFDDLVTVLASWGDCPRPCSELGEIEDPDTCPADVDRNCHVEFVDLVALLAAWGPC